MKLAVSCPANLLIMGEYAILGEGNLGLAMGTAPRLRASYAPAPELSVLALFGGSQLEWSEERAEDSALIACCLASARARLGAAAGGREATKGAGGLGVETAVRLRGRIVLDASAFFAPDGTKLGLGSSAASAVALCALLLAAGGLAGGELDAAVFPTALEAHRAQQGGRGSGYDVAASRWGGLGLFRGGRAPSWRAVPPDLLPPFRLSRGSGPVDSAAAIRAFLAWKDSAPAPAERFAQASSERVERFLQATEPDTRQRILAEAAEAGAELGGLIGVPAAWQSRAGEAEEPALRKALGAGDELFATFYPSPAKLPPGSLPIRVEEGLRWE